MAHEYGTVHNTTLDGVCLHNDYYVLKLYITGYTLLSVQAISTIHSVCEKYLHGKFDLEVIDIRQQTAKQDDVPIVVAPILVRCHPLPLCKIVGTLREETSVIMGLGLKH